MSRRLVVDSIGFGVRGAVLDGDRLVEMLEADATGEQVTDALFVGFVRAVDPKLNAAFLDIGLGSQAFLTAKDARFVTGDMERRPINRMMREGERLIVQGVREGEAGKGSRVTTDLKLFGFHLLWRPYGRPMELVGPIRGRERHQLQERGEALFPERGVTLRKLAGGVDDATLVAELARLEARWQKLQADAKAARRAGPLPGDDHPVERLLRAVVTPELRVIEAADDDLLTRLRGLLEGPLAPHGIELRRLRPDRSAFEQTEVQAELERALVPEVRLPGGGRLLIEPTAALVAVDVDSGGRDALDTNVEAAFELARQARLRNLGGTLVVDFIDLPTKPQRQRLEGALARAFRDDPVPVQIYPPTPLGLVQISRSRRGRALAALLQRPCDACGGSGRVPSLRAQAERLMGTLRRSGGARVRAAPDLHAYLTGEAAEAWRATAGDVTLARDPDLAAGSFTVE